MKSKDIHLRSSALAAVIAGVAAWAQPVMAEIPATQVYQQRGADGRIMLTDRPSPTALTERTWQVEREEPGAAQRASAVHREAEAVSARIGQRIEAEQRRADFDAFMRRQRNGLDRREEIVDDGVVIGVPLLRPFRQRHPQLDARPPFLQRSSAAPMRTSPPALRTDTSEMR
ncbi:MAG: hypothetical protein M3Z29_04330 [Pseudomonadota bacterium]|nr:hypothetical protein [Pseudomonadota bacterium]